MATGLCAECVPDDCMRDLVCFMVGVRVVFGVVVCPIFRHPSNSKIVLGIHSNIATRGTYPSSWPGGDNCFVGNTCGSQVIRLDGAFRLGPPHVNECLPVRDHLSCCDKESRKFCFSC
jgi:hypothetical protein